MGPIVGRVDLMVYNFAYLDLSNHPLHVTGAGRFGKAFLGKNTILLA